MKKYLLYGVALAIGGWAATPLTAQTQTTASSSSTSSSYVQTSKIIGTKVKTAQGEEVGVVKDVVLDRSNGCMAYTVLSAGGTGTRVTGQTKLVAVPWSVYSVAPDMSYLTVTVERDRIYNAPVFEYSRISDTTYTTNVFSHFGVSTGVGISGTTTTTGANATTGATTQTQAGAYVSPGASAGMSASPSATASASAPPAASASATASATPSATASSKATRGATREASPPGGKAKPGVTPVSPRHKGDEMMQGTTGESPAETTGSPSSTKSSKKSTSAEKPTSMESSAETSGSPSGKKSSHKKTSTEGAETAPTPGGEQE
jgi:sporulation protein YlmC with PRC-barrel domain